MPPPLIRDENLRLLLSPGHEDYLIARIRERFIANLVMAIASYSAPILVFVGTGLTPSYSTYDTFAQILGEVLSSTGFIILFLSPFTAMIIVRNIWMARRYMRYYHGHEEFLKKYDRETDPERIRVDNYHQKFHRFSGTILILLLFLFLLAVVFASKNKSSPEYVNPYPASSDREVCLGYQGFVPDARLEAWKRDLTLEECDAITGIK